MKSTIKVKAQSTVIVLPETDEHTLCVELNGWVLREDHKRNLRGNLEKIIEKNGWYNLLINYNPAFRGWEEDAADLSLQSIIEFGKLACRRAYVNPPKKAFYRNKMGESLFGGDVHYFNSDQFQEALDWVKGGKKKT